MEDKKIKINGITIVYFQEIINGKIYFRRHKKRQWNYESLASFAIGKNVIVRSRNEGINVGTVVMADETGIILKNVRRLWYHKPRDTKLSWYEGVAISGLSSDSKISAIVDEKIIIEDYSIIKLTDKAYNNIMKMKSYAQQD